MQHFNTAISLDVHHASWSVYKQARIKGTWKEPQNTGFPFLDRVSGFHLLQEPFQEISRNAFITV